MGVERCDLSVRTRKNCTYCRLERCFEIGMVLPKMLTDTSNIPTNTENITSQQDLVLYKTIDHLPKLKKDSYFDVNPFGQTSKKLGTYEEDFLSKINTRMCSHFVNEFTLNVTVGKKSLPLILNTPSVYLREMITFLNRFDAFKVLSHVDQLKVVKTAGYHFAATRLAFAYDPTTESYIIVTVSTFVFKFKNLIILFEKQKQDSTANEAVSLKLEYFYDLVPERKKMEECGHISQSLYKLMDHDLTLRNLVFFTVF